MPPHCRRPPKGAVGLLKAAIKSALVNPAIACTPGPGSKGGAHSSTAPRSQTFPMESSASGSREVLVRVDDPSDALRRYAEHVGDLTDGNHIGWHHFGNMPWLVCLCRRGDLNPHELALTGPSTYEGLSGECGVVPVEHVPCGCSSGRRDARAAWWGCVCYRLWHQDAIPGRLSYTVVR